MFHFHIVRKLNERWKHYTSSFPNFLTLFGGIPDDGNWQDVLQTVYDRLAQEDFVTFKIGFQLGVSQSPTVTVTLKEEPVDTQYFGFEPGYDPDGRVYSILIGQTATVNIMAENQIQLLALNEFVRQVIMSNLVYFEKLGYIGLTFKGADDIKPLEDYVPEQGATFSRQQTWSTLFEPKAVTPNSSSVVDIFVHADDVIIGEIQGQISEETT